MKTALFIGRFAPPHKGHINAIIKMLKEYDKLILCLGSCYESGSSRHPLLAVFREKMILLSIVQAGGDLSKIKVVYLQDYDTFDMWIADVLEIAKQNNITHFITGNKEDILDVLNDKGIALPFQFVNPEDDSDIPYHATDLRNAIAHGDYDKFSEIASSGTQLLLGSVDGLNGIRNALDNSGRVFYKGRQTVDLVFTIQEKFEQANNIPYFKTYVLCGQRPANKADYPNYLGLVGDEIHKFESPINAALRVLREKTGIEAELKSNISEPAIITIDSDEGKILADIRFLQLYNSKLYAGTQGGSSQAFHINLNCHHHDFDNILAKSGFKFIPASDAIEQGLAYQQTDMLKDAINKLSHYVR